MSGKVVGRFLVENYKSYGTARNCYRIEVLAQFDEGSRCYKVCSQMSRQRNFPNDGKLLAIEKLFDDGALVECEYWEGDRFYPEVKNSCKYIADGNSAKFYGQIFQIIDIRNADCMQDGENIRDIESKFFDAADVPIRFFLRVKQNNAERFIYGPFELSGNVIKPLYQKDKTSHSVHKWRLLDGFDACVCRIDDKDYFMNDDFRSCCEEDGENCEIDVMSDSELCDWFSDYLEQFSATVGKSRDVYDHINEFFKSVRTTAGKNLENSRLLRMCDKFEGYKLSFETLQNLLSRDDGGLLEALRRSVEEHKASFQELWKSEALADIEKRKDEIEREFEECSAELEEKKEERFEIEEKISVLNDECSAIEKKLSVLDDEYFSRIAEIFCDARKNAGGNVCSAFNPDDFASFPIAAGQVENTEEQPLVAVAFKDVLSKRACFIPSLGVAFVYAASIGNSRVFVLHVEHDWLHYEDFKKNGLVDIWKYAHENKNENVILVLDCMNITLVEGGLKPLLDVIGNQSPYLLGTKFGFPSNLKIMATLVPAFEHESEGGKTEKIGLPLSRSLFKDWGAFGKPNYAFEFTGNRQETYFTPERLGTFFSNTEAGNSEDAKEQYYGY